MHNNLLTNIMSSIMHEGYEDNYNFCNLDNYTCKQRRSIKCNEIEEEVRKKRFESRVQMERRR